MGSAWNRSWSHSRQRLFDTCERAFHFQYYPWDEPDTDRTRFLARIQTHEMVAGDCVHWAIALALRAFQRDRTVLDNLQEAAVRRFRETCTASKWITDGMKAGKKPANDGVVLHSDFYGWDGKLRYLAARENIGTCLRNFEAGEHWAFIRATDPKMWEEVDPPMARMPKFRLSEEHLRHATVYGGFDLALHHGDLTFVIDWKGGRRSSSADAQLAVYALGLTLRDKKPIPAEQIRVQAVFLGEQDPWNPRVVSAEELDTARQRIEAQIVLEESRTTWTADGRGRLASIADREAFRPTPNLRKCSECKFGQICGEGRNVVFGGLTNGSMVASPTK